MGSASLGGPDRLIANVSRCAALQDTDIRVLIADDGRTRWEQLEALFRDSPTTLIPFRMRRRIDLSASERLCREIARLGVDVLHTHDYKSDVVALGARRRCRIPWVATVHGIYPVSTALSAYRVLDRLVLRRADRVIAVSAELARYYRRCGNVTVVSNAVPSPETTSRGLVRCPRKLVFVGRLTPQKGLDVLIKALARARREVPDLRVVMVGDGPEMESLRRLAWRLGQAEAVSFVGWRDDVEAFLSRAELFVLPSRWEGHPLALMEAMAVGLPAVASDVGDIAHCIDRPEVGRLVPAGDVGALTQALVEASTATFDGEKSWRHVRSSHAPETLAGALVQIYRTVLAERR